MNMIRKSPIMDNLNSYLEIITLSQSENSVRSARSDILGFIRWLQDQNIRRSDKIFPKHLTGYLTYRKNAGARVSTLSRYYSSTKGFFAWLKREKTVASNICDEVVQPKRDKIAPRIPNAEQIQRMLELPNTRHWEGIRDKAILELMYSSGLRASELCELEFRDVGATSIHVSDGKGAKTRTVPLTTHAITALKAYMKDWTGNEHSKLFITRQGKVFSRFALHRLVTEYAKIAGIEDCTPHTLRHACATHLLERGADIRMIQEVLGHASINSTQRYTQLSSARVESMFNQFHPRALNETHNEYKETSKRT